MALSIMTQPDRWVDNLLHPSPPPQGGWRLRVHSWFTLGDLEDTPSRPTHPLQIKAYLKKVGPLAVIKKIQSRLLGANSPRTFACGIGHIEDDPNYPNHYAFFFAPKHPLAQTEVFTPYLLLTPPPTHGPTWLDLRDTLPAHTFEPCLPLVGTSLLDAHLHPKELWEQTLAMAQQIVTQQRLPQSPNRGAFLRDSHTTSLPQTSHDHPQTKPTYRLFGWGHYARTCITPNLDPFMQCEMIHEIDPLLSEQRGNQPWTTSPTPPEQDTSPASTWVIAGYHHTHAPLATEALKRGVTALVEKPVVTTHEQLDALLKAWEDNPGAKLFTGFHRRHWALNSWLQEDLGASTQTHGISMHAIVHEISLPKHHWYNWPWSGSRLLSNGCHWVDHFLWLNLGHKVTHHALHVATPNSFTLSIVLDNGAHFSLSLSDEGSDRIGVREMTQWCRRGSMARLQDQRYVSEDGVRVLREAKLFEHTTYQTMYTQFAQAIQAGHPGDDLEHFTQLWRLILTLEDEFRGQL